MEIAMGLGIVSVILWLIVCCIIAEQQEIQDEYNKLLVNEIYELKKEQGTRELKEKIKKLKREE